MARIALQELETEKSLAVADLESLIGRDPVCGIVIEGPKSKVVSGRHARIFHQDGAWWIQDMSRNGTVLDDERLQAGQRHALRVGQIIGLGESGPRLKVLALETRHVADTMVEGLAPADSPKTTAPRQRPPVSAVSPGSVPSIRNDASAAGRDDPARVAVRVDESTEPAPATDWVVKVAMKATHGDQHFSARSRVVRVGRSPECEIRIPPEQGASVSRVHAEIAVGESAVMLRDAGSRNGTFLNGTRIHTEHPVVTGDQVMLGSGGPTLTVVDLHIVKASGNEAKPAAAGKVGGSTADIPVSARAPFREPPTAPAPATAANALGGTRIPARKPSPAPLAAATVPRSPNGSPVRAKKWMWLVLAVLVIAAAVIIGRITAT